MWRRNGAPRSPPQHALGCAPERGCAARRGEPPRTLGTLQDLAVPSKRLGLLQGHAPQVPHDARQVPPDLSGTYEIWAGKRRGAARQPLQDARTFPFDNFTLQEDGPRCPKKNGLEQTWTPPVRLTFFEPLPTASFQTTLPAMPLSPFKRTHCPASPT